MATDEGGWTYLAKIDDMLVTYEQQSGASPFRGHCMVVGSVAAVALLRSVRMLLSAMTSAGEGTARGDRKLAMTADSDELFIYREIPVRLRVQVPDLMVAVIPVVDLPQPTCCDTTGMRMLWAHMQQGQA